MGFRVSPNVDYLDSHWRSPRNFDTRDRSGGDSGDLGGNGHYAGGDGASDGGNGNSRGDAADGHGIDSGASGTSHGDKPSGGDRSHENRARCDGHSLGDASHVHDTRVGSDSHTKSARGGEGEREHHFRGGERDNDGSVGENANSGCRSRDGHTTYNTRSCANTSRNGCPCPVGQSEICGNNSHSHAHNASRNSREVKARRDGRSCETISSGSGDGRTLEGDTGASCDDASRETDANAHCGRLHRGATGAHSNGSRRGGLLIPQVCEVFVLCWSALADRLF